MIEFTLSDGRTVKVFQYSEFMSILVIDEDDEILFERDVTPTELVEMAAKNAT
jgi:hypothetical protein